MTTYQLTVQFRCTPLDPRTERDIQKLAEKIVREYTDCEKVMRSKYVPTASLEQVCDGCGAESADLTEIDDSDYDVGYYSRMALCPECVEEKVRRLPDSRREVVR